MSTDVDSLQTWDSTFVLCRGGGHRIGKEANVVSCYQGSLELSEPTASLYCRTAVAQKFGWRSHGDAKVPWVEIQTNVGSQLFPEGGK